MHILLHVYIQVHVCVLTRIHFNIVHASSKIDYLKIKIVQLNYMISTMLKKQQQLKTDLSRIRRMRHEHSRLPDEKLLPIELFFSKARHSSVYPYSLFFDMLSHEFIIILKGGL